LSFKRAYFELITTLENGEGDWEELPLNQDGELSPSKSLAAANKALTVLNYGVKNGNPESCFFMAELGTGNWVTNIDLNYESFEDIISERFDYDTEDYIDMYKKAAKAGIKDSYERLSSLYF
jgi:TPR repeat protein